MWTAIIAATLVSLIGYQSLLAETNVQNSRENAPAEMAAADMATYRFSVVAYADANPLAIGPIPSTLLTFPTGYVAPNPPMWSNYISGDGTIIIYATALAHAPAGLNSAINRLVGDSTMVMEANIAAGPTSTSLPQSTKDALAGRTAPDLDAPVWFAHRG
jgi:hypothetical protein